MDDEIFALNSVEHFPHSPRKTSSAINGFIGIEPSKLAKLWGGIVSKSETDLASNGNKIGHSSLERKHQILHNLEVKFRASPEAIRLVPYTVSL